MTDFRLVRRLHAYSGGTVPDFDRISYSPSTLNDIDGTQAFYELAVIILPIKSFVKSASSMQGTHKPLAFSVFLNISLFPVMEQGDFFFCFCRRRRLVDGLGLQTLFCRRCDDEEKRLKS